MPRPDSVRAYLLSRPALLQSLEEVTEHVAACFAGDAALSLELYEDPEFDDAHLVLYVRQEVYNKDLMEGIRAVRKQVRPDSDLGHGRIHVTTDFQPPA